MESNGKLKRQEGNVWGGRGGGRRGKKGIDREGSVTGERMGEEDR